LATRAALAVAAAATATLGACVSLPLARPAAPEAIDRTPPALALWSPGTQPGSSGFPVAYFSTDRPAYATAFEVDRTGRVRVVYPAAPRDAGRVEPGRLYAAVGRGVTNDRAFLTPATNWERVPFLFVVVSDSRPNLAEFGTGRGWQRQLRVEAADAEDVVAEVAARIMADTDGQATTDFAYLGPRLSAPEANLAARCALPAANARDYWYFRELWAVFTPADPTLGLGFSGAGWVYPTLASYVGAPYLAVSLERFRFAFNAFSNFCLGPAVPAGFARFARFAGAPVPDLAGGPGLAGGTPVAPPPTSPPPADSTAAPDGARVRPLPPAGARPSDPRLPALPVDLPVVAAGGAAGDAAARADDRASARVERLARRLAADEARGDVRGGAAAGGGRAVLEPLDPDVARGRGRPGVRTGPVSVLGIERATDPATLRDPGPRWASAPGGVQTEGTPRRGLESYGSSANGGSVHAARGATPGGVPAGAATFVPAVPGAERADGRRGGRRGDAHERADERARSRHPPPRTAGQTAGPPAGCRPSCVGRRRHARRGC
jgi:hypothetical protein